MGLTDTPSRNDPVRFDAPDGRRGLATPVLPPHFALGGPVARGKPPFDAAALDLLLEAVGLDLVLVTSRQSIQYLLGGYSFYFFDVKEAL
ncbi:MAG: hypothetical protein H7Z19_03685, partial [Chitinophagaceae bacterium]|nr:hypothetical protein [Rubrivivax sp.]